MPGIFISYRRGDSPGTAGRLYDRLGPGFGKDNVFFDVDGIEPGVDFVNAIEEKVASSDVLIALIGRDWQPQRLSSAGDFVRLEIGAALRRGIRVIPVLLDGARMPDAAELPDVLAPLARRQALELSHTHFERDAEGLIRAIRRVPTGQTQPMPPVPRAYQQAGQTAAPGAGPLKGGRRAWIAAAGFVCLAGGYLSYKWLGSKTQQGGGTTAAVVRDLPCAGRCNVKNDGLTYVWIEPGKFLMGCSFGDSECDKQLEQTHEVTLTRGFWMGQTEVTQAAWKRVMNSDPSYFKGAALPVEQVTWEHANDYCLRIGGRLPTEAEWEYAARAGTKASRYGSVLDVAWIADNSGIVTMEASPLWQRNQVLYLRELERNRNGTHAVGLKKPNAFQLYDMLGNVHEWIADWYASYGEKPVTDPRGPEIGSLRAVRGGGWANTRWYARASMRLRFQSADKLDNDLGFRCAADRAD